MDLDPGAARWVEETTGSRVRGAVPLTGGITAAMYRVETADSPVVLRRWDGRIPDDATALVRREAGALRALAATPIPAPRLVAADPLGADAGVPSLLMTLVAGEVRLAPTDLDGWLRELAATLVAIHATGVEGEPYVPWASPVLPAWAGRDDRWVRAFETAWALPAAVQPVFLHRDFQPFNVLWQGDRVRGVVDWPGAGTGPRGIDVGHVRLNLAVLRSAAAAERFLELYQQLAGLEVDPRADVTALCSFGPDWPRFIPRQVAGRAPVDPAGMRDRVEDVLERALRRL
ncbi:phosphotransferase family protein [Pseudonocardia lacus]|uniref:phosphotransferase family protein n=1 Tax=Pseudonocardia lacus TaxID=2835865 RepID=UPI001BDC4ED8|nr:aminoglycoside phosphotransferase family protein [Pseudonocardia lacus]